MRPYTALGGDPGNVAGPYELIGTVLLFLQFIFTFIIVIGKYRFVRICASFLTAIFGGSAFAVYYYNQTAVGNSLDGKVLFITCAGVVYGLAIGLWLLHKEMGYRALKKEAAERSAGKKMGENRRS
jgi:hypothetical protein